MSRLSEFMAQPAPPLRGNTPWADSYSQQLRQVFHDFAARAPRSLQVHLGPSELGATCDRQVAGKMAQLGRFNHVADPWPSIRGTALHAWAAEAFEWHNEATNQRRYAEATGRYAGTDDRETEAYEEWARLNGVIRWVAERKVTPHPLHPGTADLYDAEEEAVVDHKFLGDASMDKVRSTAGPPRHYVVQLLLYGRGYRLLGLPVRRVALAAYPATAGSLAGMFVWERPHTPADDELLDEVFRQTEYRRQWAIALITGAAQLLDVPAEGDHNECHFCPLYRPQSAKDHGPGCPGAGGNTK